MAVSAQPLTDIMANIISELKGIPEEYLDLSDVLTTSMSLDTNFANILHAAV